MAKVDETNPIIKKETKILQQVCGKFLYYAMAVDTTMLHALNDLATQTTKGREKDVVLLILTFWVTRAIPRDKENY
jgi:hypothetical protein